MNLSNKQKSLIIDSWKPKDFDFLFKVGMLVYSEIFRLKPAAKQLFPYVVECEKNNADITNTHEFRIQALRFVQILGRAVRNVKNIDHDDDDFDMILFHLGERHRVFADRGFRPEYWNIFEKAVVRVMSKEITENCPKLTEDDHKLAVESWKILSHYIIVGMKKGFYQKYNPSLDDLNHIDLEVNHEAEQELAIPDKSQQFGDDEDKVTSCCECCAVS